MFHDSLSLVTVKAELDEVQDYFGSMEVERGDHVLLQKNVDPELLDFKVTPLIMQTFLEDFNKHNAQSGKTLRFSIYIDRVDLDGQKYVRTRMTGNGIGYSEEALQSLQNQDGLFGRYHVGVQNLCMKITLKTRMRDFGQMVEGIQMELDAEAPALKPEELEAYGIGITPNISAKDLYTENHNSWILVMHNEYGILDWMLSHSKGKQ